MVGKRQWHTLFVERFLRLRGLCHTRILFPVYAVLYLGMIVSAVVFFLQSECVDDDDENNAHRSVPILGVEVGMVLCSLSRLFIPLPPALRGEVGSCTFWVYGLLAFPYPARELESTCATAALS